MDGTAGFKTSLAQAAGPELRTRPRLDTHSHEHENRRSVVTLRYAIRKASTAPDLPDCARPYGAHGPCKRSANARRVRTANGASSSLDQERETAGEGAASRLRTVRQGGVRSAKPWTRVRFPSPPPTVATEDKHGPPSAAPQSIRTRTHPLRSGKKQRVRSMSSSASSSVVPPRGAAPVLDPPHRGTPLKPSGRRNALQPRRRPRDDAPARTGDQVGAARVHQPRNRCRDADA